MGSSNLSFATKSCACASIAFVAVIISLAVDCRFLSGYISSLYPVLLWHVGSSGCALATAYRRQLLTTETRFQFTVNLCGIYGGSLFRADSETYSSETLVSICSPPTRRRSLLELQQMRMRKILWRMTSCYCPSWKQSNIALSTRFSKCVLFSVCA